MGRAESATGHAEHAARGAPARLGSGLGAAPGPDADVIKPYRNAMRRHRDLFAKRLESYLDCPGGKQLHDLRTSIRRLESTYDALPKSERPARSRALVSAAKDLFRRTGPMRDSDVILNMLAGLGIPDDSEAVAKLRRGRDAGLEAATARAKKIASLRPVSGLGKIDRHKMASRRRGIIWSLFDDVRRMSAVVASDESKIAELHAMRKTVKRLRYLLEDETQYRMYYYHGYAHRNDGTDRRAGGMPAGMLHDRSGSGGDYNRGNGRLGSTAVITGTAGDGKTGPLDYDASLSDVLDSVKQVQESAGAIHDCDIATQYVIENYSLFGGMAAGILDEIQKRRHELYLDLVSGREGGRSAKTLP